MSLEISKQLFLREAKASPLRFPLLISVLLDRFLLDHLKIVGTAPFIRMIFTNCVVFLVEVLWVDACALCNSKIISCPSWRRILANWNYCSYSSIFLGKRWNHEKISSCFFFFPILVWNLEAPLLLNAYQWLSVIVESREKMFNIIFTNEREYGHRLFYFFTAHHPRSSTRRCPTGWHHSL